MELPKAELIQARLKAALDGVKKLPRLVRSLQDQTAAAAFLTARARASEGERIANEVLSALSECHRELSVSWSAYLGSGEYRADLLKHCLALGLTLVEENDSLFCFPSTVRIMAAEEAVLIDGHRTAEIDAATVAARLKSANEAALSRSPIDTLEMLFKAYVLMTSVNGTGTSSAIVVTLLDIYGALTLWPEHKRKYSRSVFAIDLYALDRSGVTTTRSGSRLVFTASTGARDKSKVLQVKDETGADKVYYGIYFIPPDSTSAKP